MALRQIKAEADILQTHIFEMLLDERMPDPDFLHRHATSLLEWVRLYDLEYARAGKRTTVLRLEVVEGSGNAERAA